MPSDELIWATDVHLDHVGHPLAPFAFGKDLRKNYPTCAGLVVTGDIAEGPTLLQTLRGLREGFEGPVYFVLGNHDYYRSSFSQVDALLAEQLSGATDEPHWLRQRPVWLESSVGRVALVGNGGFYDGRLGDRETDLQLSDFTRIEELFVAQDESRAALFSKIAARCDTLTHKLALQLDEILLLLPRLVLIATHVPPFQEAAFHAGQPSNGYWAPFFSSQAMGDMLLSKAQAHAATRFLVLCGHTHGSGRYQPLQNLEVVTGAARYGAPELAGRIDLAAGVVMDLREG